jgi:ABC-type lipopolysaccharide export system ATPase subunit
MKTEHNVEDLWALVERHYPIIADSVKTEAAREQRERARTVQPMTLGDLDAKIALQRSLK